MGLLLQQACVLCKTPVFFFRYNNFHQPIYQLPVHSSLMPSSSAFQNSWQLRTYITLRTYIALRTCTAQQPISAWLGVACGFLTEDVLEHTCRWRMCSSKRPAVLRVVGSSKPPMVISYMTGSSEKLGCICEWATSQVAMSPAIDTCISMASDTTLIGGLGTVVVPAMGPCKAWVRQAHLGHCISCSTLKQLYKMTTEHCHFIPGSIWDVICQMLFASSLTQLASSSNR